MPICLKGYEYWKQSLELSQELGFRMSKIYEVIAKKEKINTGQVERAMRYAREKTKDLEVKFNIPYNINNKSLLVLLIRRKNKILKEQKWY